MIKKHLILILATLAVFLFYLLTANTVNRFLSDSVKFSSWRYTQGVSFLRPLTSWDSGFYYDLASNWYPKSGEMVSVANLTVPPKSWFKIFVGSGAIGDAQIPLEFSTEDKLVNNVVFVVNNSEVPMNFPIKYAYLGIPYCEFTGPISFEADVLSVSDSLSNPLACGVAPCDRTFIYTFDLTTNSLISKEEMFLNGVGGIDTNFLFGTNRSIGVEDRSYEGRGCKSIQEFNLNSTPNLDYERTFTTLSFTPLFPLILKGFKYFGIDLVLSGILMSLLSTIITCFMLYKLFLALSFSDKKSMTLAIMYLISPFSFFNFVFLPIALLNLFFVLILYFSLKVSLLGIVLSYIGAIFTHVYGFFIFILLFMVEKSYRFYLAFLAGMASLLVYFYYLYFLTGDVFAYFNSRKPWYGDSESFVGSFINYFFNLTAFGYLEVLVTLLILFSLVYFYFTNKHNKDDFISKWTLGCVYFVIAVVIFNGGFTGVFKFFILPSLLIFVHGFSNSESKAVVLFVSFVSFLISLILLSFWSLSIPFVV